MRIAFFSCQDWMAGFYGAHADLAARDDIDVVVCLGDYVYERAYISATDRNPPVRADDTAEGGETQTLEEYRRKYALYHSDPDLQAVRARHPIVAIWDDHEVEDNYADREPGGATRVRRISFLERRANSYRAFFEHMPRLRRPEEPDRIYGSLPLGAAEIFFLDTRQYRSEQPCKGANRLLLDFPCLSPEVGRPDRTLLGAAQLGWLKDGLSRSSATWKVIANQVMIMSLDLLPRIPLNVDSWDGYPVERRELIDHIAADGIRDVTFITGDIHTFFAGSVTRTGHRISRDGSLSAIDGPPRATEFVGGAISSPGLVDRWAGPGETERVFQAHGLDQLAMVMNQHLAYVNQAYKGYGVMEAGEAGLTVEFRAVRDARVPGSPCFTLRRFSVARGSAHVVDEGGPAIPLRYS